MIQIDIASHEQTALPLDHRLFWEIIPVGEVLFVLWLNLSHGPISIDFKNVCDTMKI